MRLSPWQWVRLRPYDGEVGLVADVVESTGSLEYKVLRIGQGYLVRMNPEEVEPLGGADVPDHLPADDA